MQCSVAITDPRQLSALPQGILSQEPETCVAQKLIYLSWMKASWFRSKSWWKCAMDALSSPIQALDVLKMQCKE